MVSMALERHPHGLALDLPEAVQGVADGVHHAAHEPLAHGDAGDPAHPADVHSFLHLVGRAQEHGSHVVLLEVHHHPLHSALEFQELARLRVHEPVDAGHAVADGEHGADFLEAHGGVYPA